MKYHIVGIEKCGTQSLKAKLLQEGHEVVCHEWLYPFKGAVEFHEKYYHDYAVIIILRDPIQRCFSDYRYAVNRGQIPEMSLEEALDKYPRFAQGSCYGKWLKKWSGVYHEVLNLDEIGRDMQVSNGRPKHDKSKMSVEDQALIAKHILKAQDELYYRDDIDLEQFKGEKE